MMMLSNGNSLRVTGPLWVESTSGFIKNGKWRGVLMFPLIFAWTKRWANNRGAGDMRCHRAHYDVSVMSDDVFKCISLNENGWIKISLKFVRKLRISNDPAYVQIMAWRRPENQATSHYLNQWLFVYWRMYASLGFNEVKFITTWTKKTTTR